ncbi:MAG: DUF192 domain-containing protein [Alphaproteobacteria bacterium]|jgi:uncharacterized membrane protein (UPF0127 family)
MNRSHCEQSKALRGNPENKIIFLIASLLIYCCFAIKATASESQLSIANKLSLNIKVADNDSARMKGLMFVNNLPENEGMLFIMEDEAEVNMWMKNTYIPLDMIFVNSNKEIVSMAENTKPLSTEIISSKNKVKYVLEINGGLAKKSGLKIGDKINYQEVYEEK